MRRLVALAVVALAALGAAVASAVVHRPRGYLAPVFSSDGSAVFVVVREVRGLVLGFGYEGFSPPAHVRLQRDRFRLVRLAVADGREERVLELPPSPLEGSTIRSYRSGLYGSARAALRPDGAAIEYEVAVTRPDQPSSTTFVARGRWIPGGGQRSLPVWQAGSPGMRGPHASQLSGALEVVAVRGGAPMPCAVVLLAQEPGRSRPLVETEDCRSRFPDGYDVPSVSEQSSRSTIERSQLLASTHERLVAEARARGLSEGDAALEAVRGMQRLGLYPKPTQVVAHEIAVSEAREPIFDITDEEFDVGLFSDLRQAIEHPGTPVGKHSGRYVIHDAFETSRRLNAHLGSGATSFLVRARGKLWRLRIERP